MGKFFAIICCIALAGCMVGPDFRSPEAPHTKRFTAQKMPANTAGHPQDKGPAKAQFLANGRDIPGEWWKLFHSKELNCLIRQGLANSPNLSAAKAAVRQAQETWRAQFGSLLWPSVDGQLSAVRQRSVIILPGETTPGVVGSNILAGTFNTYTASSNLSYMLDIFGGARRELEYYCAQVEYQQFQLEAAYIKLTTNIVTNAINIASLQAQIAATEDIIRSQESQLDIIKKQFNLGAVSNTDVLTQETQVAISRATLPPLQLNLAKAYDALAVLVGSLPSEIRLPKFNLAKLNLPANLPVSLPSSVVRQRPDIRAQEALLHAASAQIGVATANLFPQVTITANYGWTGTELSKLFSPTNLIWNYGAGLLQPIFRGGALLAERRAAIAAFEQAACVYRETVLLGFQNVADSLEAIRYDAKSFLAQQKAESVARKTLQLTEEQYRLGGISYLILLNAQRQYQLTIINRIQAQAARYADTAALFQALGGGWWNNQCAVANRSCSS